MKFTFLGTGTSQGVPVIACECNTCQSDDKKDKRLRSSLLFEKDDTIVLFDAGPDFRQQMLRANVRRLDAILLTHEHKDHIAGMDDVRAFNYRTKDAIDIYAEKRVQNAIKREYAYVFSDDPYPGVPMMRLNDIYDGVLFHVKQLEIIPIRVMHWNLPIFGFRIGTFAYITDASYVSDESINRLQGVKYLVVDALRREKHLSHFNVEDALEFASKISPEKVYFTHIGHQMGRYDDINPTLPHNVMLAYDGLCVETDDE